MAVFRIWRKEMIVNQQARKPCEGIWWRTSNYRNIPKYNPDISIPGMPTVRIVSKAEKEAWEKALSASLYNATSSKTPVMRTVSKAEKEAWEYALCEAKAKAFSEEREKEPIISATLNKVEDEVNYSTRSVNRVSQIIFAALNKVEDEDNYSTLPVNRVSII